MANNQNNTNQQRMIYYNPNNINRQNNPQFVMQQQQNYRNQGQYQMNQTRNFQQMQQMNGRNSASPINIRMPASQEDVERLNNQRRTPTNFDRNSQNLNYENQQRFREPNSFNNGGQPTVPMRNVIRPNSNPEYGNNDNQIQRQNCIVIDQKENIDSKIREQTRNDILNKLISLEDYKILTRNQNPKNWVNQLEKQLFDKSNGDLNNYHSQIQKVKQNIDSRAVVTKENQRRTSMEYRQQQHQKESVDRQLTAEQQSIFNEQVNFCKKYLPILDVSIRKVESELTTINTSGKRDESREKDREKFIKLKNMIMNENQLSLEALNSLKLALEKWKPDIGNGKTTLPSQNKNKTNGKPNGTSSSVKIHRIVKNKRVEHDEHTMKILNLGGNALCQDFMDAIYLNLKNKKVYNSHAQKTFSTALAVLGVKEFLTRKDEQSDKLVDESGINKTQDSQEIPFSPAKKRLKLDIDDNSRCDHLCNSKYICTCVDQFSQPYEGPPGIPDILEGEVVKLPYRYDVNLDQDCYIKKTDNITNKTDLLKFEKNNKIILSCSLRQTSKTSKKFDKFNLSHNLPKLKISLSENYPQTSPKINFWSQGQIESHVNVLVDEIISNEILNVTDKPGLVLKFSKLLSDILIEFKSKLDKENLKTLTQILNTYNIIVIDYIDRFWKNFVIC